MLYKPLGFYFCNMESEKQDLDKQDKHYWRPVMVFYAKSTAWVLFPLILALVVNKYFLKDYDSQNVFLAVLLAGFGITCFGIYKEIKKYKESLDKK
jgi:hypothetical protein